jgi:hypothetical protein
MEFSFSFYIVTYYLVLEGTHVELTSSLLADGVFCSLMFGFILMLFPSLCDFCLLLLYSVIHS